MPVSGTVDISAGTEITGASDCNRCAVIEILYSTFNNLFPENHPLRKWWSIIKYIPRISTYRVKDSKIFFHPITTEYDICNLNQNAKSNTVTYS